jgi:hypothetical protein
VFSAVLLFAAFRVITARSTVHAALFLMLAFFNASGIWMLLKAEFLAITLVLVYVGAVMVLFLFVVMMLDINTDQFREGFWKHCRWPAGRRGDRARDGLGADGRLPALQAPSETARGLADGQHQGCWASRSTPTTCTRCRWRRCCCWWPSSPPSR